MLLSLEPNANIPPATLDLQTVMKKGRSTPARNENNALREQMAYEAARIVLEQGSPDFDRARTKAAARTGISDRRHWPTNEAIQEAILAQRRLFRGNEHHAELSEMRAAALYTMRTLRPFSPHLIGTALTGAGNRAMGVELFLLAEHPEEVLFALIDLGIPWQDDERTFRYKGGRKTTHPVFRFVSGDIPFQLIVLPPRARRNPPVDEITDSPRLGADLAQVEELVRAERDPEVILTSHRT